MSAQDADANPSTMFESKVFQCVGPSSVANATRIQVAVGTSELKPAIEKIKLRKVDGWWKVTRPGRGVVETRSWEDAHQIMVRLASSDIRAAKSLRHK